VVTWAIIVGAFLGWLWCDLEVYGLVAGAIPGAIAGLALRKIIRREIAATVAALRSEIDALRSGGAGAAAAATAPVPAPGLPARARTAPADAASRPTTVMDPPRVPEPTRGTKAAIAAAVEPRAMSSVPSVMADVLAAARSWLFGGNTIVRVGLVILFIGMSFLARYAASAGLFPIELRLALVAAVGVALLAVGFRHRDARTEFGLALQGAGVATIYLTVFAAAKWFGLASAAPALVLMSAVCALGVALALLQRSQSLAVTAFAGGFAAPLLLSTGTGSSIMLFGYFTVLNLGILAIARRTAWRVLNLVGFAATFGIAALWQAGGGAHSAADTLAAHGFVIASVLIYLATAILQARRATAGSAQMVDTTLLFGPAVAGFGLEVGLLRDHAFGSAFAALAFAALYIAAAERRRSRAGAALLDEALLAVGIGFVTLAIPLAMGARWTSAAWALEGAGAVWVGVRQARWAPRAFGLLLQLAAALIFLTTLRIDLPAAPLVGPGFIGAMLAAGAALATSWWLRTPPAPAPSRWGKRYEQIEARIVRPAFLAGFALWCGAWAIEATRLVPGPIAGQPPVPAFPHALQPLLVMLAYAGSALLWDMIGRRLRWPIATWPGRATIPFLAITFLGQVASGRHVFDAPSIFIWAACIAIHLRLLYLGDRETGGIPNSPFVQRRAHIGTAWLGIAIALDGVWLAIDRAGLRGTGWGDAGPLATLTTALLALTFWATRRLHGPAPARWPLAGRAEDYGWIVAVPIAALVLLIGVGVATASPGNTAPLPYLPIFNPVDLTLLLALAALWAWRTALGRSAPPTTGAALVVAPAALAPIAGFAFVIVNTIWLRVAHHLLGVGWHPDALMGNSVVQGGLAILWTLLALGLMVVAHRRAARIPWLVGAALLGITVAKLLLVDMNNAGGGARIVTFMGVGVLMLVVGYLAPLPPRAARVDGAETQA
jgi:uncharacterized membrane protein